MENRTEVEVELGHHLVGLDCYLVGLGLYVVQLSWHMVGLGYISGWAFFSFFDKQAGRLLD